jgi:hypothetical protein
MKVRPHRSFSCIKGEWVKSKTIYNNNKSNKEITEYTPFFRKTVSDDLNQIILEYYTDAMKDIIETYKMKRKKEEREKKIQKEKEKQAKMVTKRDDEKIDVKNPSLLIIKKEVKSIKIEKVAAKPIVIT